MVAASGGLWLTSTEMNILTEVSISYYLAYADIAYERDPLDRLVRGRQRPHASNRYDDFGGDLRAATFGFGHRSRRGHAATASDSYCSGLVAQLPLVLIVLPALLNTAPVPYGCQ